MFDTPKFSSVIETILNALDNATRCNCRFNTSMVKEPVYVLVKGAEDRRLVMIPIDSKIDMGYDNNDNDSQYHKFSNKSALYPTCMDTYDRGVTPDLSMNLLPSPTPTLSSMRAKAKLQEAKDFRNAMEYIIDSMKPDDTGKERLDDVDLDSNSDCDEEIMDLIGDLCNEDDSTSLTYEEELQLLHLMDIDQKNLFNSEDIPEKTDNEYLDSVNLESNSYDENVCDMIEEPFNEDDSEKLSYEEEQQLLHLMDDSGKIVWENYDDEENFETVVGTNVESIQPFEEVEFKDESLINQNYLILESAPPTDHYHA